MDKERIITRHITHEEQGLYFEIPFDVPENVFRIDVRYQYDRHRRAAADGGEVEVCEVNIVDLGLSCAEQGFIDASGSNRVHVWVSAQDSVKGYKRVAPKGRWAILVGAYRIEPGGADVVYTITFTYKERALYLGDAHMHTLGSDGKFSVAEIAHQAMKARLDYIVITDHNNMAHNLEIPAIEGITVIPGMEWTHYQGHANFIGHPAPVRSPFCINDREAMISLLLEARQSGAAIVLNHILCPNCGWRWGFEEIPFDLVEIWNGADFASALGALQWWHDRLCGGAQISIIGGSDFHSLEAGRMVGLPCTAVYAMSNSAEDLVSALKRGNSFLILDSKGPRLSAAAGGAILGEAAPKGTPVTAELSGIRAGDEVHCITNEGRTKRTCARNLAALSLTYASDQALFMRFEVYRKNLPIPAHFPVLVSNAIYFE